MHHIEQVTYEDKPGIDWFLDGQPIPPDSTVEIWDTDIDIENVEDAHFREPTTWAYVDGILYKPCLVTISMKLRR